MKMHRSLSGHYFCKKYTFEREKCDLESYFVLSQSHVHTKRPWLFVFFFHNRRIQPAENFAVSLVAMGEGWHNYHHVFPWDYRAAEIGGYLLNMTTMWLDFFASIGWAYDLKSPSKQLVQQVANSHGDGSRHEVPETTTRDYKTSWTLYTYNVRFNVCSS